MAVMAIIFILAGMMVVVADGIRRRVRVERTNAILDVLATACEGYWTLHHDYPFTTPADVGLPNSDENVNVAYVYLLGKPRQPGPLISVNESWFEKIDRNVRGPDGRTLYRVVDGFGNFVMVKRALQAHDVKSHVRVISAGPDGDFGTVEDNLERYVAR